MKIPTLLLAALIHACLAYAAFAAGPSAESKATAAKIAEAAKPELLFNAKEFQVDALYQARTEDLDSFEHGGGVRVAYFPWRAAGIGLEGRTEDVSSALFDRIGVSLIGRFPIEKLRLAPEIRIGSDYDFEDSKERNGQPGTGFAVFASIGAELRLSKRVGVFSEVRGVRPLENQDREHILGLAGIRLTL